MVKLKLLGSSGRFGVRYGQSVKRRISDIELRQRKKQACIFCGGQAKRKSKGIWKCKKCGRTFAGHAYFLEKEYQKQIPESKEKPKEKEQKAKPEKAPKKALKKEASKDKQAKQ